MSDSKQAVDVLFNQLRDVVEVIPIPAGLLFRWARTGTGWGELVLKANVQGRLVVDTERMSDAFCLDVIKQAFMEAERKG